MSVYVSSLRDFNRYWMPQFPSYSVFKRNYFPRWLWHIFKRQRRNTLKKQEFLNGWHYLSNHQTLIRFLKLLLETSSLERKTHYIKTERSSPNMLCLAPTPTRHPVCLSVCLFPRKGFWKTQSTTPIPETSYCIGQIWDQGTWIFFFSFVQLHTALRNANYPIIW